MSLAQHLELVSSGNIKTLSGFAKTQQELTFPELATQDPPRHHAKTVFELSTNRPELSSLVLTPSCLS